MFEHSDITLREKYRCNRGGVSWEYKMLDPKRDMKKWLVVWGRFRDKVTDKTFYVYNTHFPTGHHCERVGSAHIMAERIAQRHHPSNPVIAGKCLKEVVEAR